MKIYGLLVALLLVAGIGLFAAVMSRRLATPGQAGIAYTENEDGELIRSDERRESQRTRVPVRETSSDNLGDDEEWLTKFTLIERSGKRISSEELKGQPYVAGFFFTTCPSICVKQNGKVQQLQEKFKDQRVRFLSISCDPEVDRPPVLTQYAERFQADKDQWLFFTGDMPYIRRVGAELFSLGVMRQGHPEKFALMDAEGKMFGLYTWSDPAQWQALQRDIQKLIDAGGSIPQEEQEVDSGS